jgi:uncharacterized membrane protein YoaK (UPF0700 family)
MHRDGGEGIHRAQFKATHGEGPLADLPDAATPAEVSPGAPPPADERPREQGIRRDAGADRQAAQQRPPSTVIRDRLVVGLAFSAGVVDAISYLALGKVFTAFMTGNIVFLGFGAITSDGPNFARVAVTIAAFALGVALSARIASPVQDEAFAVWHRHVTVALSVVAVAQAGFLIGWIASDGHPSFAVGNILVGLSAVAMGIQMDTVLSLQLPHISTTAATATLVGLVRDIARWSHSSAVNNGRRLRIVIAIAVGAAVGALLLVHARLYAPVLPLITTVIVVVIAAVALKPQPPSDARGRVPAQ